MPILRQWFGSLAQGGKGVGTFIVQQHLAAIVESAEDAIIGVSLEGRVTSWNAGAERIYDYRAEEVLHHSLSILLSSERSDELPELLDRIKNGNRVERQETVHVAKNGRRIPVALTFSPIRDKAARIVGASMMARDITSPKEAEAHVKRLQGILPICMHCHRIQKDAQSWENIEEYVMEHSEAKFSHSICPNCMALHYREFLA